MSVRLAFLVGLVLVSVGAILGAPKSINSEKDLRKNFVEFLQQDATFLAELERAATLGEGALLTRHRRQTDIDELGNQAVDDEQKDGGFFDRAARFVMDLLQRFLKWVNSDSN